MVNELLLSVWQGVDSDLTVDGGGGGRGVSGVREAPEGCRGECGHGVSTSADSQSEA